MRAGRGDGAELAGRLDDVLGARAAPVDQRRVALAEERDAAAVELEGLAVGRDGEVVGVGAAAVGRVEGWREWRVQSAGWFCGAPVRVHMA